MTREAFDLSERFGLPVMVRLVTRLAHSRAVVRVRRAAGREPDREGRRSPPSWILLPANARGSGASCCGASRSSSSAPRTPATTTCRLNDDRRASASSRRASRATTTSRTSASSVPARRTCTSAPTRCPSSRCGAWLAHVSRVLVLEEGYPFVERLLRGLLPPASRCMGKESGRVPPDGELTPDTVRAALGLRGRRGIERAGLAAARAARRSSAPAARTATLRRAEAGARGHGTAVVTSDIGCYTLGALPPLLGDRIVRVHGRVDRHGEGRGRRRPAPGGRGDRRQHLPALRRDAADGRGRGEHRHDARHPRQRDDRA